MNKHDLVADALAKVVNLGTVGAMKWLADSMEQAICPASAAVDGRAKFYQQIEQDVQMGHDIGVLVSGNLAKPQEVASAPENAPGSVDTSEFRRLTQNYAISAMHGGFPKTNQTWGQLVAHIDAWHAAGVAAAVDGIAKRLLEAHDMRRKMNSRAEKAEAERDEYKMLALPNATISLLIEERDKLNDAYNNCHDLLVKTRDERDAARKAVHVAEKFCVDLALERDCDVAAQYKLDVRNEMEARQSGYQEGYAAGLAGHLAKVSSK